ncbi:hypothetical protein H8R13_12550 [Morganella morganii]|uniref:hypothetical protein n=1 Tax=Morganella morganii TaxID=582 RepID=UPI00164B520D|nr:hypothetical protein [Morganella morganii]MBC4012553.1 hypothetical protein [Morganella morganii]MCF1265610.1 hypothetical protein [Morganella morganii]MDS0907545.1 hypothetical protein [Morganella morganii]
MQLNGIVQQAIRETSANQATAENKNSFQAIADKCITVVNSDKSIFAGCLQKKKNNIRMACGALLAKTLVKNEYYTEGITGDCVKKLNMTLPDKILARKETGVPGSDFISRWSDLNGSDYSAQELYDMLSKQLHKQEFSPEIQEKMQAALKMAEKGSGSESILKKEYAEIIRRHEDEIKNNLISDILTAHDINDTEGGPVLEDTDIIQLELMKDISFYSLKDY